VIRHWIAGTRCQEYNLLFFHSRTERESAIQCLDRTRDDVQYGIADGIIVNTARECGEFARADGGGAPEGDDFDSRTFVIRQSLRGEPRYCRSLRMRYMYHAPGPADARQRASDVPDERIDLGRDPSHLVRTRLERIPHEAHVVRVRRHGARIMTIIDARIAECRRYDERGVQHVLRTVSYSVDPGYLRLAREEEQSSQELLITVAAAAAPPGVGLSHTSEEAQEGEE